MSHQTSQQALAMPMIETRGASAQCPREFLTLGLVGVCLSFWTVVVLVLTHLG